MVTLILKIGSDPEFLIEKLRQADLKESQDGFLNVHIDDNSEKLFASLFSV
jgi:hypothetical protein